jgi:hypothetical protein
MASIKMRFKPRVFLYEVINSNIDNIVAVIAMLMDIKTITRESIAAEYFLTINVTTAAPEMARMNSLRIKTNIYFFHYASGQVLALLEAGPQVAGSDRLTDSFADLLETIKSLSEDT